MRKKKPPLNNLSGGFYLNFIELKHLETPPNVGMTLFRN